MRKVPRRPAGLAPRGKRGLARGAAARQRLAALLLCAAVSASAAWADPPALPSADEDTIEGVVVTAPEPRYVAPTRVDRIGRIWVPVFINDKGPFRLVLDTGASQSAIRQEVALALGAQLPSNHQVVLHGTTGTRTVDAIAVQSLVVGDLNLAGRLLPIVQDALGGAEGVMGTEGLLEQRIRIEFLQDRISVQRSHGEPAPAGFVTVPLRIVDGLLVVEGARVGGIATRVIIDTGGRGSVANTALQRALRRRARPEEANGSEVTGATLDTQIGDRMLLPEMTLGALRISPVEVTVGDFYIFRHWNLTQTPTLLLGMDVLGLVDTLIIDYRRRELQVRTN